jgi:tripartite-type tricarboxylate transporter receptor subunit TctC
LKALKKISFPLIPFLFSLGIGFAGAQTYPAKPIRFIVPWSAGSGTDLMARAFALELTKAAGQPVVVDNRGGAGATIGTELAAKSPSDGTVIYVGGSVSMVVSPILYPKVGYDPIRDFAPVSLVSQFYNVATVHPSLPVKTVKDLIAYAKASPSKLNYASTGTASLAHLAAELFAHNAGIQLVHIPYKGVGASLADMFSGRVQMSFLSAGSVWSHVRSGKLRALAIASEARAKMAPDLPTMAESGMPGFVVTQWHGMLAPRGTPKPVVDRLYREVVKATQRQEVVQRLALDGTEVVGGTPAQFGAFLKSERERWASAAKAANIKEQ